MTTNIPEEQMSTLYSKAHPAIILVVTSTITVQDAARVSKAVCAYIDAAPDAAEMLPVWIRFTDVKACDICALQPYSAPADRAFLSGLVLAIDGVDRYLTVSSFDYKARQFPGKGRKRAAVADPLVSREREGAHSRGQITAIPDPTRLPLSLRFFACEEALGEARKLGQIYDRWPFYNFSKDDLRVWSDKLVAEFAERFPYLAEVDNVIGGKLTNVITQLGNHPHQPPFELRRFWASVQNGGVKSWTQLADDLLHEIAKGTGNTFQHYEEQAEHTPATAYLYSDDRSMVSKSSGFLKRGWQPASSKARRPEPLVRR